MGKHQIMSVPKEARRTSDWDMFATWVGTNAGNGTWFIGWAAVNTFIAATSVSYLLHDLLSWTVYGKGNASWNMIRTRCGSERT